jgi:hypothetical protein
MMETAFNPATGLSGRLESKPVFASVAPEDVVLTAMKKAEDSDALIPLCRSGPARSN